jgi:septal ring factor EnvC (AmiA/AmiB activator)
MAKESNGSSKELQELEEEQSKLVNDLSKHISNLMKLKDDLKNSNKNLFQINTSLNKQLSEASIKYDALSTELSKVNKEHHGDITFLNKLEDISLYDRIFNYKKIWKTYKQK